MRRHVLSIAIATLLVVGGSAGAVAAVGSFDPYGLLHGPDTGVGAPVEQPADGPVATPTPDPVTAPATETPADDHDAPAQTEPTTPVPGSPTDAPGSEAPESPTPTDAPATDAPATDAPATDAPATDAPEPSAPATPAVDMVAVQTRLSELHYYVGAIDGKEGPATRSAVMAFQKVNHLGVDGVVGPKTLAALEDPVLPTLRGGAADRIEVDLTAQVLYLVQGGELVRIVPVSSGSGETYRTKSGGSAHANTPTGTFTITRHIRGEHRSDLGILYSPMYFYKGWAIHGSPSVPAYPASHGCVRVNNWDIAWMFDRVAIGTSVQVYGGSHVFRVN